ncbi:MAG: rod shape-determining protein RodA, partial [Mycobacteriales bacterium]
GLLLLGALLVWSATKPNSLLLGVGPNAYLKKDVLTVVVGVVLGGVAAAVDYRTLRSYTPVFYGACILGLLAVLSPLGARVNGAHAWISIGGGFEVQPSEFTKLALVLGLAMLLAERHDAENGPGVKDICLALALAGLPLLLILVEPDLGVVLVCLSIVMGVLAMSGAPARWIVGLLLLGVVGSFLAVHLHLLKNYQLQRLTAFANPHAHLASSNYNTHQAETAIGSGGLTGTGLFRGSQTNGHFVPEQQTDFIFTVAGEELGFVGSGLLIVLLGLVLWRGLRIAARTEDQFGRLVAVGLVCWLGFQSFENIGMTLGIMPVTGIPLPFVSYGGSAMFANMIAVGLLQNVHLRSRQ